MIERVIEYSVRNRALIILAGIAITELVPQPHVPTAHEA